jgi:hypothetical protein
MPSFRLSPVRAHRRDAVRRRRSVVVLLLQVLLWMAGPTIEARAEARAVGATAHVEALGGSKCPPIHSHLDCQICRTLRTGFTVAVAPALPTSSGNAIAWDRTSADVVPETTPRGPLGSRAPPCP